MRIALCDNQKALLVQIASEYYLVAIIYLAFGVAMVYYKMKIHSSCEIEYFVETHLCKLCVIL